VSITEPELLNLNLKPQNLKLTPPKGFLFLVVSETGKVCTSKTQNLKLKPQSSLKVSRF
jgi:hypothetical protein